ncbi:MAG: glycosyltransferase family 4 protein [Bacteroidaceae bacterium]|nr:glycosyltransferase family 4 protein [Bacteroidaceae bacterium]
MNQWKELFGSLLNRKSNILYIVFHGFEPNSGITKKIHNQIRGLQQLGHTVHLCYYGFDERHHRVRWVDDKVIADYGRGSLAAIRARFGLGCIDRWCRENEIDMVYVRSFHNASPQTVTLMRRLRRNGIPVALEIPTYPYDSEYAGFPWREQLKLFIDRRFRNQLAANVSAIVTFSDCQRIFGQRTIRISNGVNFDKLPLTTRTSHDDTVHLTAVAEVHYWHGLDRLIDGLGHYYASAPQRDVIFHIVGGVGPSEMHDSQHAPGFAELIERWHLQDKVVFHGQLFGDELTAVFNQTDLAIGSLARHRSGITTIKTLKNREYAARGIPFIYSEQDSDFDHQPYVLRVPADESPISIPSLLEFLDKQAMQPEQIRASVKHLSWEEQMRIVVDSLKKPFHP